jgi:hypothetical protein
LLNPNLSRALLWALDYREKSGILHFAIENFKLLMPDNFNTFSIITNLIFLKISLWVEVGRVTKRLSFY